MAEHNEKEKSAIYEHLLRMDDMAKREQAEQIFVKIAGCYSWLDTPILDFELGESILITMPVRGQHLNAGLSMQGGIISAAFDNAFGALCQLTNQTARRAMTDMSSSYHRPIFEGDELKIQARVVAKGKRKIYMRGEAFNGENKLVATSAATYMLYE